MDIVLGALAALFGAVIGGLFAIEAVRESEQLKRRSNVLDIARDLQLEINHTDTNLSSYKLKGRAIQYKVFFKATESYKEMLKKEERKKVCELWKMVTRKEGSTQPPERPFFHFDPNATSKDHSELLQKFIEKLP